MSSLDLAPPAMPGEKQKKGGFLKKFLFKNKKGTNVEEPLPEPTTSHDDVDIEEIKRKLGLHEEPVQETTQEPAQDWSNNAQWEPEPAVETSDAQDAMQTEVTHEWKEPLPTAPEPSVENEPVEQQLQETPVESEPIEQPLEETPVETEDVPVTPEPETPVQTETPADWTTTTDEHTEEATASSWDTEAAPIAEQEETTWDAPEEEAPAVHAAVEEHLSKVDKAHEKVEKTLEQHEQEDVPDWHMQDKEVPEGDYFILQNGHPVKSLKELMAALSYIDDSTFEHHVSEHRNDFANWIAHAVGNQSLAEEVRSATEKDHVLDILNAHRKDAEGKVHAHVNKRKKVMKKLEVVEDRIGTLKKDLAKKSKELSAERKRTAKKLKAALNVEVQQRVAEEKTSLQEMQKELEAKYAALEKDLKQEHAELQKELSKERVEFGKEQHRLEAEFKKVEQQKSALEGREHKLGEQQAAIQEQRQLLHKDKQAATELLKDAKQVKKDLEQIQKHKEQVQANLKEITTREGSIRRHEESLKQREHKLTKDLTNFHAEEKRLKHLRNEHDTREGKVRAQEAHAAKMMKDAMVAEKSAIATEKKSIAKIKAETKKLESVRKKMEKALAKVIKNKKKAMAAATLRKHLEEIMTETKEEIEENRVEMEKDAYEHFMKKQRDTTPIGQPDAAEEQPVGRHVTLHKKLQQARGALEKNDLNTAKQLYNELRVEFQKAKMGVHEKNSMYASIRELYDDIHLSMLG